MITTVEKPRTRLDLDLLKLLEKLVERDPEFIKRDFGEGQFLVRLNEDWLVIRTKSVDDFDFMRLERALKVRIKERGWHYGIGLMSAAILHGQLARIFIPATSTREQGSKTCPYIPRPLWIWESHQTEDALALLRVYVQAVEKIEELNAHQTAAA